MTLAWQNYVPKVKTGHVVPGIPLDVVKQKLSEVKGSLVEAPLVSGISCWLHDWLLTPV